MVRSRPRQRARLDDMPELPDVTIYVERLDALVRDTSLERIRITSPWVLRTVAPPPEEAHSRVVTGVQRLGKRIVIALDGDLFVVIHLMVAGRLRWRDRGAPVPRKRGLAAFDFEAGTVLLTEEGTKRRASVSIVSGVEGLAEHDRGGIEPLDMSAGDLATALRARRRSLKRALTDPTTLSGIGGAYSDEIMHRARLSPIVMTDRLDDDAVLRLHEAIREVLTGWTDRLRSEVGDGFPEKVTAFHPGMAVHGKYGEPCPVCGSPVQRIVYADNETNYCAGCQTGGRILADRALSRLLKEDFPRALDEQ